MQFDPHGLFSLDGKVALVAGASRGIGLAIAQGLVEFGARVTGCGRSNIPDGIGFEYIPCDVSSQENVSRLFNDLRNREGGLDVYIHVAGITLPVGGMEHDLNVFETTLDINLTSAYRASMEAVRLMSDSGGGSVIFITSIGSILGFPGNPGYVAAKGGLRMLAKAMALDFGRHNIRVNSIAPGYIHTSMTANSHADPKLHAERLARMILPRWGTPEDIVGAAIFLASDASAYITGHDLVVDGGWTAKGL